MPQLPENKTVAPASAVLNPDEREELEQLRVEVAYLKKLQALLREKNTPKRATKRWS
ncbi:hypothetical protein DZS_35060 [Dickeya ananatis]